MTGADWTTRREGETTLVEVVLANDGPARRVRVENDLDGPLYPPRTDGVPAEGWDEGGYEGRVGSGERLALGYATPAEAGENPPVSVEWLDPLEEEPRIEDHPAVGEVAATADGVVRELEDPRPPRDAVPVASETEESPVGEGAIEGGETEQEGSEFESKPGAEPGPSTRDPTPERGARPETGEVDALLAAVERRVGQAEALTGAGTLGEATRAVESVGSVEGVRDLEATLSADAERLAAVEQQVVALRERCEGLAGGSDGGEEP